MPNGMPQGPSKKLKNIIIEYQVESWTEYNKIMLREMPNANPDGVAKRMPNINGKQYSGWNARRDYK